MFHIPAHKQGSTAPVAVFAAPAVVAPKVHTLTSNESRYQGKYPNRIAMVSGSRISGLYLRANGGLQVRMDNETAYALCQALGKTKNGPQLGDDITPYLPTAV